MNILRRANKNYLIVVLVFIIIVITGFGVFFQKTKNLENKLEECENNATITADFNTLTIKAFEFKIKNSKNPVFVYIGNGKCSDCSFFNPKLKKMLSRKKLTRYIYYVDAEYLHKNYQKWTKFKAKYNFSQTPCLMIFKNGERLSKLEWDSKQGIPNSKLDNWLTKNKDIIKESY